MKQRALVEAPGARSSTTSAPVASAAGTWPLECARATKRAPAACAQIAARWLLPEPSGPDQHDRAARPVRPASISASAAAFDGPPRKSSRARLSA